MYVNRWTTNVKGNLQEAAALWKELWERFPPPHAVRIQTSWLFPNSALAVEVEFTSLAEYEEFWRGVHANPEVAAWFTKNAERQDAAFGPRVWIQEMWELVE